MDNDTVVNHLIQIRESQARLETKIDLLSGPDGRIKKLEEAQTKQWWISVAIAPALALAHGIARKLGVQI